MSFVTVKEAANRVGKSTSSIRRFIYPIIEDDAHSDRVHIEPNVEDAFKLRMKGEKFAWRLSEDLLQRAASQWYENDLSRPGSASRGPQGNADGELLAMLRRELDIKNQQITQHSELISKQMELISGLSERLREGNILIGGLQQRLALTDGRDTKTADPVNTKTVTQAKAEKGSGPSKPAKPKRGFWKRMFQ